MVTPKQCTKLLEKEDILFRALVSHIDRELMDKYYPGETVEIAVGSLSSRLVRRIKDVYGTHWKVGCRAEQRDGDRLSFEALEAAPIPMGVGL
jgi:hypothetical protein